MAHAGVFGRRLPSAAALQMEGVLTLGGLRALLLQLAHPAVGHGVADHSRFAEHPLGRLHGTLTYIYVVADGDPDLMRAVTGRIGRMHARVQSAPDAAVQYDARDALLQRWVAATIHDTSVLMAALVWGPLPRPLADELLHRNAAIGTSLGMPAHVWPADTNAFNAAFAADLAGLRFDDATIAVVRELLAARAAPAWVRMAMPWLASFTAPMLPPALRDQIGLHVGVRARVVTGVVRAAAPVYRILPRRIRTLPARRYLAAARTT